MVIMSLFVNPAAFAWKPNTLRWRLWESFVGYSDPCSPAIVLHESSVCLAERQRKRETVDEKQNKPQKAL